MTATAIRAKLSTLADGVTMATPSPLVRLLWHHNGGVEKAIAYLGFTVGASLPKAYPTLADDCHSYLSDSVGRYNRSADAGVCKPRKAERVEGAAFELKWHRPDAELLHRFIRKDLTRA